LASSQQPQQGGLAVAVAPDDPGAVALPDAEGHVVEQVAGAVRLAHALQVDEVARHSAVPDHAGTGDGPVRPAYRPAGPGRAQRDGDVDRVLRAAGQEDHARPAAGDETA